MGPAFFVRRTSRQTTSAAANKNRSSQAKPNCVCERTIQMVPSAMTDGKGLWAIRAVNRPSHAKPETIDMARLIHKVAMERILKAATVVRSRTLARRKDGEAMNKSKKTIPARITDEPK